MAPRRSGSAGRRGPNPRRRTGMDDDAAIAWAIRLDNGPLDDQAQSELDAWLAADERRAGALLRAEATLSFLDRGRALAEPPLPAEGSEAGPVLAPRFGRRAFLIGGGITGLAAAAG